VLRRLPPESPAILVALHMPAGFTQSFAARLNDLCSVHVSEAQHGERVLPGRVYLAPGGRHLRVGRNGAHYIAVVDEADPVNRHRPSIEVLFRSAAQVAGRNAFGIMLTGMGNDGAAAMREMKDAGSYNIAQDEGTSVVFGMPKEAIAAGAVDEVLPLDQISGHLIARLVAHGALGNHV
jgi:two-component system chemotaxis response regulator CheB